MTKISLLCSFLLLALATLAQSPTIQDPPGWTQAGINYVDDNTVILQLFAPNKDYVYALGDFNGWQQDAEHLMYKSVDGNTHWIQLTGIEAGAEYRYQYHVYPDNIRIADWFADKILDPWNDQWISEETYPGLIEYPWADASDPVSVFQTAQNEYNWTDQSFTRPAQHRLNIYELLVRDFTDQSRFSETIDELDYLQNLGINAIEVMPVSEFEGNESWGYNPSFYFAPDKYYGPKNEFKRFVNECHQRGIAVILDMTLNHSFGLSPMVRLYFDTNTFQPTGDNPWFNTTAVHDYSPGYDFNHESTDTREFCKRVLGYWLEEYHIDGYRMDLSKGFTQNWTLGDVGAFNQYDQSRINILTDYYNHSTWVSPGAYFILEHFADNDEEVVLSNTGMMLWGNLSHSYGEIQMGYSGDLGWASYQNRGWTYQNLVTYAESHDEERMMFKSLNYGNNFGGYNVTDLSTSLERMKATQAFLLGIPGPKMMWQFGEIGYDESIELCGDGSYNSSCRVENKPTHWEYLDNPERLELFKYVRAMLWLRRNYDVFATSNFNLDVWGFAKAIRLYDPGMNVVIIGNFDVVDQSIIPGFPNTGTWYDYFTGASFIENNLSNAYSLAPGEFHIYTDQPLDIPDIDGTTGVETGNEGCTDLAANNYNSAATIDDGTCEYTITFQVDMSTQTVSGFGVHIAGSFQGWNPGSTVMSDIGSGIYEYSTTAIDGEMLFYKFINGNDWGQSEVVPPACGADDGFGQMNRYWTVTTTETIPVHCFSSCVACQEEVVDLTFQVNMENETVSSFGVHIAGSFQGWAPGLTPMTDLGNGIWEYQTTLGVGEGIEFKYVNGNAWGMDESVPPACATGPNRFHTVGATNEILEPVCFATCDICPSSGTPGCTDNAACNYNSAATTDDGSCDYSCLGCTNSLACNYDPGASTDDGSCDMFSCYGCTDAGACNYDFSATMDDGSCNYDCMGCTDSTACNFDSLATMDDGSCDFSCFTGCTYPEAENYNSQALEDDGSCVFGPGFCGPGTSWDVSSQECVNLNTCPTDLNGDNLINTQDLLIFLGDFGGACE